MQKTEQILLLADHVFERFFIYLQGNLEKLFNFVLYQNIAYSNSFELFVK
jgi:hypothetical protein